ncbi:CaiB/BaiF CoA transferase family protein [Caenispirillum salinarum]|uniref:CaiB/BaiF CoA transferase family protein n=1 Tax=Caenispirillum salinarum TaxID=859058 RepID=UPI00384F2FFD
MSGPLSHVRVLDLSRVLAGPWAGQMLADMGAEVIKVERPGKGDDTRGWGPPYLKDETGDDTSEAAYYLSANRGKRSVTIDFTKPEGQALVRDMAANADVVIENFKVGGLKKYGLDYESLKAVNPALVYCSITGFGQDGPYAHRAGYDFMIQGMGGLMSLTGAPDGAPGGEPMKVGVAITDIFTGMYATSAIQAALIHKERTGEGQHIDMALLDVQVATLANQAMNYLASGVAPKRLGNSHPNIVPYQAFPTADGYIILAVGNDAQFTRFCKVAGLDALAADERFATNAGRVRHREELVPQIAEVIGTRSSGDWLNALEAEGVPCGPINTLDQVFADPQVVHRGMKVSVPHPLAGHVDLVASPMRFSGTPVDYDRAPPTLGQDTDAVLEALGVDEARRSDLREKGII